MTLIRSGDRYAPTLFIGLGGSGVAIVHALKTLMASSGRFEDQPVGFLAIDFQAGRHDDRLAPNEFLPIGSTTIAQAVHHQEAGALDWLPSDSPWRRPAELHYGAGRHRHLGHLASSLNRKRILEEIRRAAGRIANRHTRAFVIASLAGGTGSGMLFDVAVTLHELQFPGSIDAMLLLPDVFESVPYTAGMRPIAYGTLIELAALESGRLTLPSMKPGRALFGRVYLQGTPAVTLDEAFRATAGVLEAMSIASLRRKDLSPRAVSQGASIFSTAAKTSLRLLRHRALADVAVGAFLRDLVDGRPGSFDDGIYLSADVVVADLQTAGTPDQAAIASALERFIEEGIDRAVEDPDQFSRFSAELSALYGGDGRRTAEWLRRTQPEVERKLRATLETLAQDLASRPRSFERLLEQLSTLLPSLWWDHRSSAAAGRLLETLERERHSLIARLFPRLHIAEAKRELLTQLRREQEPLIRRLVLTTMIELVGELLEQQRRSWASLEEIYRSLAQSHPPDRDAEQILQRLLSDLGHSRRAAFETRFLSEFNAFHARYSATRDPSELDRWLDATRDLFADTFPEPFVAPELLYAGDQVKSAILQLTPGVFDVARVDAPDGRTVVTLLIPADFDHDEFTRFLVEQTQSELHANVLVERASGGTENEIVLLLESHAHTPAEIRSIRRYEAAYRQEADRTAYHFDKNWPVLLADFINSLSVENGSPPRLQLPRRFDIGLVVPLHEEFEIVQSFWPVKSSTIESGTTFLELDMSAAGVTCIATVLREMGPSVAASRTEKLLSFANIGLVVLLGIAGSLDSDVELADIVVADEVAEFHAASKAVPAAGSFAYRYSGFHFRTQYSLIEAIAHWPHLAREDYLAWRDVIREKVALDDGHPRMHVQHVASGNTVGAADAFKVELLGIDRKFCALEMEGAGVARAAEARHPAIPFLIIRGISDYSDERKRDFDRMGKGMWRSLAVHSACDALTRLLRLPAVRSAAKIES